MLTGDMLLLHGLSFAFRGNSVLMMFGVRLLLQLSRQLAGAGLAAFCDERWLGHHVQL
jgi:hypothetical protein